MDHKQNSPMIQVKNKWLDDMIKKGKKQQIKNVKEHEYIRFYPKRTVIVIVGKEPQFKISDTDTFLLYVKHTS